MQDLRNQGLYELFIGLDWIAFVCMVDVDRFVVMLHRSLVIRIR